MATGRPNTARGLGTVRFTASRNTKLYVFLAYPGIPFHMEYRKNDHLSFLDHEKDGKRKSCGQCTTDVSVDLRIAGGILSGR